MIRKATPPNHAVRQRITNLSDYRFRACPARTPHSPASILSSMDNFHTLIAQLDAHLDLDERNSLARLLAAAPVLLGALEAASCPVWVHNAAITTDIEALRRIALWHADWNNTARANAIDQVKGRGL
jgi:hypothetical protein